MGSVRSSRAASFSSDRPSIASSVTFQMPSSVRPSPAYIAASVASQTVTDHHNAQLREENADSDELENAVFSEQALQLLNGFLDHLLFAFLSSARSPSLTAIRPAISEVLKPRLAREATEAADEELEGLLAGEDEEEFPAEHGNGNRHGASAERWEVEKVWKRTRLRIMVYTRLGELEDEDEEKYVQQERGLSMDDDDDDEAGLVSWASAIFLTSVIEYVAEQTLLVAGSAAFARMASKMKRLGQQRNNGGETAAAAAEEEEIHLERLIIEEPDVEKIALNSALGRLWRTWRKRIRSPISPGRGIRPVSSISSLHRRKLSHDTIEGSPREPSPIPEHTPTETEIAANIPLPVADNDINEIEVPGLANAFDTDDNDNESSNQVPVARTRQRPSSVIMLAPAHTFLRTATATRPRPLSMPPPATALPFSIPHSHPHPHPHPSPTAEQTAQSNEATVPETPFETPMEYAPSRDSYMATDAAAKTEADSDTETETETETEILSAGAGGYESEHKIMQSKRMSVGKPGPPGVVRTFSTRSSSLRSVQHTPVPTPNASSQHHPQQQHEATSYLDDGHSSNDEDQHEAIGIAHTSDIPIRSTPTPPVDTYPDKTKYPAHGGYVELQPRHAVSTAIAARNTPTPEGKPNVPQRSAARQEFHKRELSAEEYATVISHANSTTSPSRRQDVSTPTLRGPSLPSLQEADSPVNVGKQAPPPQAGATPSTPQRSPTRPVRDVPTNPADRQLQRKTTAESNHSQQEAVNGSPSSEKSAVQRVASSASSSRRVGSFTAKHTNRNSEASQRSQVLRVRMSEEDREREFDSLVKGEDTVKFTLTPQTVRDLEVSLKCAWPTTSSVTIHPRTNADKDNSFGTSNLPTRSASRSKGPVAAQHKASPSRKVVTRPLAREPRIEAESMRDFADFIRSTGPSPGQEKAIQPFVNISGNGPKTTNASTSSLGRKLSIKQNGPRSTDGPSSKQRANMQPRSPAGLSGGNDDLIDFIRQGPPSANSGQPRIPRSVAPFRTTVDSDQFDQMLGEHGNVESAYGSTASTLESKHSTQTINSRTGLLPEPKIVQPAYSNTPQNLAGNMASSAEPHITRTRRRIKDPYAIDLSDDEDEDQLTALPPSSQPPQAGRQESLMDFLNGMDPPSNNKPQPFMLSEETIAAAKARANTSNSTLSSAHTATNNTVPSYGAISSTSIASDAPRAYQPRLQARAPSGGDPRVGKTATSDLADFLRNSGPPEPAMPTPPVARKEEEKKTICDIKANTPYSPVQPDETPAIVFFPKSTHKTSILLKACNDRRIAVTSFSGGTGLGGVLTSSRGGVCVSFENMKDVIALHEDDMDVVVQPGLGWVELNALLKEKGLFFPVDPAPGASIGGMIAMSCSGTNAYRYGTMKSWVISLTCVLADGRIIKTHNRPRKSSAGYDLTHLIIGSEGTLALVTEAVLRLSMVPQNIHVGIATFDTFQQGVNIALALQKSTQLEAMELADGPQMHCLNVSGLSEHSFTPVPTLFLKFADTSRQVVEHQIALVQTLTAQHHARSFEISNEKERTDALWAARKSMGRALIAMKAHPTDLFLNSDCAVPISNLSALVVETQSLVAVAADTHSWFCANVSHVGDGNVHSSIICPVTDRAAAESVMKDVARLALRLEGTVTGEHGVGLKLREVLVEEVGLEGIEVMRSIKESLDAKGILNPDKVFTLGGVES
ncbi:hypothetical protein GQ44DRAFT_616877 [Phaeosphaeriaceae sp. PMI808]|nr:hypothetical protein GQ44DRAFT_616877 [Phaeosphaeriaceae sp. PMI808]